MGLFDWLYKRKREKEALEQFEKMEQEYNSVKMEYKIARERIKKIAQQD